MFLNKNSLLTWEILSSILMQPLKEGHAISKFALHNLIKKYEATGALADLPCRQRKVLYFKWINQFINKCLEKNDGIAARLLRNILEKWPSLFDSVIENMLMEAGMESNFM